MISAKFVKFVKIADAFNDRFFVKNNPKEIRTKKKAGFFVVLVYLLKGKLQHRS